MRRFFQLFALLDVVSIFLLMPQIWMVINNVPSLEQTSFGFIRVGMTALLFISLFFSAVQLYRFRKKGIIVYYFQFPFRIICWVFSIGFITLIPQLFDLGEYAPGILLRICMGAEFFRLYYLLQAHRKAFRMPFENGIEIIDRAK